MPVATVAPSSAESSSTDVTPSQTSLRNRMERALRDQSYEEVLTLHGNMLDVGFAPDIRTLNMVVAAKSHLGGVSQGLEFLQVCVTQHPDVQPDVNTYRVLMLACQSDKKTAFSLYDQMLARGIQADAETYSVLTQICTWVGDFDAADELFKTRREQGVMKDLGKSYLAYIYNCMRADEVDRAFSMLMTMEAEWRYPDTKAYESMLRFFARKKHMEGQLKCVEAISLEAEGRDLGTMKRTVEMSLGALMMNAQAEKDEAAIFKIDSLANKVGCVLNARQEVGFIITLLHGDDILKAFQRTVTLYQNGQNLPPRATQLLASKLAAQASSVDDAYYLLESRKAEGYAVPLPAVNVIIEACAEMGDLDRAFATWAELDQLSLQPDTGTYNALLHTCVQAREVASGRRLINRMQLDGVRADATTYAHHCGLLVMSRQGDAALGLLQTCSEAGVTPTPKMYITLINHLLRRRMFGQAQELLTEMKGLGNRVVSESFERKVLEACSQGTR